MCGFKDKVFRIRLGIIFIQAVAGSPLRSVTSPTMGSWLGIQYQT